MAQDERLPPLAEANRVVRLGVMFLLVGFGGFLLWAVLAPLDEGVAAQGVVIVEGNRKAVQHLQGGIISKILVGDGDLVKVDQPLLELDKTQLEASLATIRSNYWQTQALNDRLQAERNHAEKISFSSALTRVTDSAKIRAIMLAQEQLFVSRRIALVNERSILEQAAAGAQEQVKGLKSLEESRSRQIALLEQDIAGLRELVADGYAPRSRLYEMERMLAQINGERGGTLAEIQRANRQIAEAKLRILQSDQNFQKDVDTQLSQVQPELERWTNELHGREEDLERTTLRAPSEGRVVGLSVHTVGGVIKPGELLMEIVPENERLIIDAQLPTHLIDKVHTGLPAEIRFSSLGVRGQVPVLSGQVSSVSADRLVDQRGVPYYAAKLKVDPASLQELQKLHLRIQPGMPAEVLIKTGERSLLDYLLRPLLNHFASALKEQ